MFSATALAGTSIRSAGWLRPQTAIRRRQLFRRLNAA
jgi:hypothetical protein